MHEEFARNKMTRITTHEDGWEKVIWKDAPSLWYVLPTSSLYKINISSAIFTKLVSCLFLGCVVQKLRLSSEFGKLAQNEYKWKHDSVGRHVHWYFSEKPWDTRTYKSRWWDTRALHKERENIKKYNLLKDN